MLSCTLQVFYQRQVQQKPKDISYRIRELLESFYGFNNAHKLSIVYINCRNQDRRSGEAYHLGVIGCRCFPKPGPKAIYVCKAVESAMQCSAANMQLASKLTGDAICMMSYYVCQQANKHTNKHTDEQASKQTRT